jgi:hypothetical protein
VRGANHLPDGFSLERFTEIHIRSDITEDPPSRLNNGPYTKSYLQQFRPDQFRSINDFHSFFTFFQLFSAGNLSRIVAILGGMVFNICLILSELCLICLVFFEIIRGSIIHRLSRRHRRKARKFTLVINDHDDGHRNENKCSDALNGSIRNHETEQNLGKAILAICII